MHITIDKSHKWWFIAGLLLGAYFTATAWWASGLSKRDELRQQLLVLSTCDDRGFVTIIFPGGGEFTCAPAVTIPPNTRPSDGKKPKVKSAVKMTVEGGEK